MKHVNSAFALLTQVKPGTCIIDDFNDFYLVIDINYDVLTLYTPSGRVWVCRVNVIWDMIKKNVQKKLLL